MLGVIAFDASADSFSRESQMSADAVLEYDAPRSSMIRG
jgi:hypothetical protein